MKIAKLRLLVFIMFLLNGVFLFAGTLKELPGLDIREHVETFAAFAGLVLLVTPVLKRWLNSKGWGTRLLSWLFGSIVGFMAWFLQLGIFAGIEWYHVFIYSVGAALVANGLSTIGQVQLVLRWLGLAIEWIGKLFKKP